MTEGLSPEEAALLSQIEKAFSKRARPPIFVPPGVLHEDEVEECMDIEFLSDKDWRQLTVKDFDDHFSAFAFLDHAANCYFLPGMMCSSIKEHQLSMPAYAMRSEFAVGDEVEYWPEGLTGLANELVLDEVLALKAWMIWSFGPSIDPEVSVSARCISAIETIEIWKYD